MKPASSSDNASGKLLARLLAAAARKGHRSDHPVPCVTMRRKSRRWRDGDLGGGIREMMGWTTVVTKSLTPIVFCNHNEPMITWDEPKRKKNLRDHGIDLAEVACVFDAPMVTVEDEREHYGEQRLQSLGWFHDRVVFLVWMERNDSARLISCRYGDKHETRAYFEALGL